MTTGDLSGVAVPRTASSIGPVLLACAAEHDWSVAPPGVAGVDAEAVSTAARWHGVEGPVWLSLRAAGIEADSVAGLAASYHEAVARHLKILGEVAFVREVLADLPFFVIKGPVLAQDWYSRPDLRTYIDLDVVVPPAAYADALVALEAAGCQVLDRNWPLLTDVLAGELHVQTPRGTLVDLHWSVVNHRDLREAFHLPATELMARSVRSSLDAPTLDPVDTLVHLGLHASLAGADRLGWLKDVEQVVLRQPPDWPAVVVRARESGTGLALALVLARSRQALRTPVPDDVIAALAPGRAWRALLTATDRVSPVAHSKPNGTLARMVARSARTNGSASAAQLVRRSAAFVRHRGRPYADSWDPADPRSGAFAAVDGPDRAAYLRAVSRQR